MPPIFSQKSSIVSLVLIGVGIYCHIKGTTLSSANENMITQAIGLIFDILAGNIAYFVSLHNKNKSAINQHADVINQSTATASNPGPSTTATVLKLLFIGGMAAAMTGCLGGCAQFNQMSDQDKVSQAETVFTTAVTALSAAKTANLIDAQDYHTIVGIETTISAAFDTVHADLDAGGKLDGNTAWSVLNTTLQQLAVFQWRFTNGRGNNSGNRGPASLPSSSRSTDYSTTKGWAVIDYRTTRYHRTAA